MEKRMKKKFRKIKATIFIVIPFLMLFSIPEMSQAVKGTFLYSLSDFTGTISYNWVRLFVDEEKNEVFVIDTSKGSVRIFNENGMEIYQFGEDRDLGMIYDGAAGKDGSLFLLSLKFENNLQKHSILRCNFRGEPVARIDLKNLPREFSNFLPDRLAYRKGRLYLADLNEMKVVVADEEGSVERVYDIASLLGLSKKQRDDSGITGFSVDGKGNVLFTIPVFAQAYRVSPDGKIVSFGQPGGAPGRFNVVGGIVSDSRGNFIIADRLKCAVMVFDRDFNFLAEFGYRGYRPGNLIAPDDLALDSQGRLYVTQGGGRGVTVYRLTYVD